MLEVDQLEKGPLVRRLRKSEYWHCPLEREEDPPEPPPRQASRPVVTILIWYLPALIRVGWGLVKEWLGEEKVSWPDRILSETRAMEAEMAICCGEPVIWVRRLEQAAARRVYLMAEATVTREYSVWLYSDSPSPAALLPAALRLPSGGYSPAVLLDLARQQVRSRQVIERVEPQPAEPGRLRVMTYNVHGCVGMDGRLSPERVARVIARYAPHVVALQELDSGRKRSRFDDQAERLAQLLEMDFHFQAAMETGGGEYGNAVLSRIPMRLVKAGPLPHPGGLVYKEPRGAMWVEVEFEGTSIQLFNTHLGLMRSERLQQIECLLGPEWVGAANGPVVVCGDMNAGPATREYALLGGKLRDSQPDQSKKTWFGRYPVRLLDYIFVEGALTVERIDVPRTRLTAEASDHLPLIVDLSSHWPSDL